MTEPATPWSRIDFPRFLRDMAGTHGEGTRERAVLLGAAVELERVRSRESYLRRYVERLAAALAKAGADARAILANPQDGELAEALRGGQASRAAVTRVVTSCATPASDEPEEPPPAPKSNGHQPAWMKWKRIADSAQRGKGG